MRLKQAPNIAIRNDSQAISSNEIEFVRSALLSHKLRVDGRALKQLRPARIQLTRAANTGDATCTVTG